MIDLEIEIETEGWHAVAEVEALCRRAADAALAASGDPSREPLAATLLLADDVALRELNRRWRGQDKATNVLSFPSPPMPGRPRQLGDIALSYETTAREAAEEGKSLSDHVAHLVVHGLLHLLGHDHLGDDDAEAMEGLEVDALLRLGIGDPYAATGAAGP